MKNNNSAQMRKTTMSQTGMLKSSRILGVGEAKHSKTRKDAVLEENACNKTLGGSNAKSVKFTIPGKIPSIKNTLRCSNGHFYHQDDTVREYKRMFSLLTPLECKGKIPAKCQVDLKVVRDSRRSDPTNKIDTVMDALEYCGVIENDRLAVKGSWDATEIDPNNPRVEVEVTELCATQ